MTDFGWDLPPGVTDSMIPGNRPEDEAHDRDFEELEQQVEEVIGACENEDVVEDVIVDLWVRHFGEHPWAWVMTLRHRFSDHHFGRLLSRMLQSAIERTDVETPDYVWFHMPQGFDTALPQTWVDRIVKETGHNPVGHFVWSYDNYRDGSTNMMGLPFPTDLDGIEILSKLALRGGW